MCVHFYNLRSCYPLCHFLYMGTIHEAAAVGRGEVNISKGSWSWNPVPRPHLTDSHALLQLRSWSDGLNKKLLAARRATAARKQRVSALSERLRCASGDDGPLAAALKRSRDIRACYPDMMYSLRHTHGLLITRRNSLVVSLFQHFRLQPMVPYLFSCSPTL